MKLAIVCSDIEHPVMPYLELWCNKQIDQGHSVVLVTALANLHGGDVLFLVSCSEILTADTQNKFRYCFVLHASDLPKGRGWSPYIWNILEGSNVITLCLLEAATPVDSGRIWLRSKFKLEGHELLPEIHEHLFTAEISLMDEVIENLDVIQPVPQEDESVSYYQKRTPEESKLDPDKTLSEQFNLLRVVDSDRFPAYFDYMGHRYILKIEKDV